MKEINEALYIKACKLFAEDKLSVIEIAKEIGKPRVTINRWKNKWEKAITMSEQVENNDDMKSISASLIDKITLIPNDKKPALLDAIIKQSLNLIEIETDLNKLSNFFRALAPYALPLHDGNKGGGEEVDYYTQVMNRFKEQYNKRNNGQLEAAPDSRD